MQTVYLLKNCINCYRALIQLYNKPDLSTNIIIVNKSQSRMLLLDKRIKSFPFIINTMPTNIGLVPKIARVLPLDMFLRLKIGTRTPKITQVNTRIKPNYNSKRDRGSDRGSSQGYSRGYSQGSSNGYNNGYNNGYIKIKNQGQNNKPNIYKHKIGSKTIPFNKLNQINQINELEHPRILNRLNSRKKKTAPIIKRVPQSDGGVSIILSK